MTLIMRLVRAEMLEVLRADYIRFARARGLSERAIHFHHALKNTLVPVITVVGSATRLDHSVLDHHRDRVLLAGDGPACSCNRSRMSIFRSWRPICLFIAFLFVIINLVVDILYVAVDPRLRATVHGAAG